MKLSSNSFVLVLFLSTLFMTAPSLPLHGSANPHAPSFQSSSDVSKDKKNAKVLDEEEALRVEEATELEKAKARRRDILVYTCFGLALFILLWMRRKGKLKAE